MLKYAKVTNNETKQCMVGLGTNAAFYTSQGMTLQDVEEAYNGEWYLKGYAPQPTEEYQRDKRAIAYANEVDPITCHIQRLQDEEQTPEIVQEIEELKEERAAKVEEIKERYPYPQQD